MAKTENILEDNGISLPQLVKLYRFDLLDVLSNISGIGCRRIEELRQDLEQAHSQSRLPQAYTWIYKLAIDTLKIPTDLSFYHLGGGVQITLSDLRDIDSHIATAVNDWLDVTLSRRELAIIQQLYRDGKSPREAAPHFGLSYQMLTKLKGATIRKLQSPKNQLALRGLICHGGTTPST